MVFVGIFNGGALGMTKNRAGFWVSELCREGKRRTFRPKQYLSGGSPVKSRKTVVTETVP